MIGIWLRCCLVLFAVVSALCVCGPALYFTLNNTKAFLLLKNTSCPPCPTCHCAPPQSLFNIASDCGKDDDDYDDPDVKEEMQKDLVDLLSEELKLQRVVVEEQSRHMNGTVREARSAATHYKRETEKCNTATQICEEGREWAEMLLARERKITLLWQRRAKLLGWDMLKL